MANGWGQGTWGAIGWGGIGNTSFAVTGVAGTTAVGDEGTTAGSLVIETGLEATASVGTVAASSVFIITPTGISVTASVGTVLPKIPISFGVTGFEATIGFLSGWGSDAWGAHIWGGGVFADVGQTITPATNVASALVQTPTVTGTCAFSVTGVVGTTAVGDALAGAGARVVETGLTGTVNIGNEAVSGTALVSPTGVSASILISGYSATTITYTVTVVSGNPSDHPYYNQGSTNKYAIDGSTATADVELDLFERNTYKFDQSHSSNDGHPINFYEDAAKNTVYTNGISYYLDGVEQTRNEYVSNFNSASDRYVLITVPEKAPTLHYQCYNHALMGYTANTPIVYDLLTTTGAPVTTVVGTTGLGNETVIISVTPVVSGLAGLTSSLTQSLQGANLFGADISSDKVAQLGSCVLSLTGVSATGATGEEQVYSLIEPTQVANWIEKAA
jgi:hypothetical protein